MDMGKSSYLGYPEGDSWVFPGLFWDVLCDLIKYTFHAWHDTGSDHGTDAFFLPPLLEKLHNFWKNDRNHLAASQLALNFPGWKRFELPPKKRQGSRVSVNCMVVCRARHTFLRVS